MNDMNHIDKGFAVLRQYEDDTSGEVNVDVGAETIYAGPENIEEQQYTLEDRAMMENNYWHYNANIQRWGYAL